MADANPSISLPIKEIVEAQIKVAVMQALQPNAERIIEQLVHSTLNSTVKEDYRDHKFLDFHFTKMVQEEVKAAVREYVAQQQPAIRKAVSDLLNRKKYAEKVAQDLVANLTDVYCSITIKSTDR